MQPNRRRARAAVEAEGDGALAGIANVILGVGHVKNAGFGRAVCQFKKDRASSGGVLYFLAADFEGMLGRNAFFFRDGGLFFFLRFFRGLFRGFFRLRLLLLGRAKIRCQKKRSATEQSNGISHTRKSPLVTVSNETLRPAASYARVEATSIGRNERLSRTRQIVWTPRIHG